MQQYVHIAPKADMKCIKNIDRIVLAIKPDVLLLAAREGFDYWKENG